MYIELAGKNVCLSECSMESADVLIVDPAFVDGLLDAVPPLEPLPPVAAVPASLAG